MSPSPAIKMSSPWDRKTFFVSPGRLAKPKNLRVIGGGGATGGGRRMPTSVVPFFLGVGITATEPATKIFLPFPAYLIPSLWLRSFKSSVGSKRGSTTGAIFPEGRRCMAGLPGVAVAAAVIGLAVDDDGQNS